MGRRGIVFAIIFGLVLPWSCHTQSAHASGFAFFEHGTKAMGMAGAFTAQADDPSAMFHNVGGLAFLERTAIAAGTSLLSIPHSTFRGFDPSPGTNATGEQVKQVFFPSHAYWAQPLGDTWRVGVGVNSPFGLATKWRDPNNWPGRFISVKANLISFDLNPSLAWQVTPKFGVGGGAIFRFSRVELIRRLPAQNPLTRRLVDVADVRLKSDFNTGYGWNIGMLHKATDRFSWGFSYRSRQRIKYSGKGRFTQISTGLPPLDAAIASTIPVNQDLPIATKINFPDMASLGLAYALNDTRTWLLETDVNWTGWGTFRRIDIRFPQTPRLPTQTIPEDWKSVFNYRAGLRWTRSPQSEWRFGYFFDTTPQPEHRVNPLLPDADRNGFSVGYGYTGGRFKLDLAAMVVPFNPRTTRTNDNVPPFYGRYKTDVLVFGVTLGW